MFNMKFVNIHDVLLIMAIAIVWHILAQPLYDKIDAAIGTQEG